MRGAPEARRRRVGVSPILAGALVASAFVVPALGQRATPPASPSRLAALEARCSNADHAACVELVTARRDRAARRRGLVLPEATARSILERSCLAGWAPACDELLRRLRPSPRDAGVDDERARWLALACDFGSGEACRTLGDAFLTGAPLADASYFERVAAGPDPARAARYYAEACALGVARACGPAVEAFRATDQPCEAAAVEARACAAPAAPSSCGGRALDEAACAARHAMPVPPPEPPT